MSQFELLPLRCGHIVDHPVESFLYRTKTSELRIDAPCIAWLLRSPTDLILVDTGPGTRVQAPQHYRSNDPDDLLPLELVRVGIKPDAIKTVILTHLHNDHVGGAEHFPEATFYVQLKELQEAVWPVPFQRPIYEVNRRGHAPAWTSILDRYVALDGDTAICPGVSTVMLPGHTSGSQGVLVDTNAGPHLLPGDLVPLADNWKANGASWIPNGNHTDLYACERSFQRLAALGATVLPSHDPRVFDHATYPLPQLAQDTA
ncbi:N-acyl homoserine lactonase family protein [Methylobacterium sp. J-070]|uniref:N-acyl homoserine lactonase family protein n=1 Tax=Methylobacterium sp. J-070 TaxID=2836650 RepID=UPI001FB8C2E1|nr:N-acyl homoserine lactonase family protein [Methylobacterium sp. J-070]MCJ2049374.1 N-acyl homoserine lactonase family protein [Methylobacterium sp. J-070]